MKKHLLFLLLLPALAWGGEPIEIARMNPYVLGAGGSAAANPCSAYLICQGFEGTGYDNLESWSELEPANSVVDPDYTAAPLVGSQSLMIDYNAYGLTAGATATFTAQNEVWAYMRFKINYDVYAEILQLQDSTGTYVCKVLRASDDVLSVTGRSGASTVGTASINVEYHLWMHYQQGNGGTGICSVGFSTDGTEPTSGNNFISVAAVDGNKQADRIFVGGLYNDNTAVLIIDKVRVKTSAIGSNPE